MSALGVCLSVCDEVGTCVDDDGERLRYGVLSLFPSAGDGVPALRRSALPMAGPRPCGVGHPLPSPSCSAWLRSCQRDWRLTPQLWAARAPRRHALALKAKLQRLARAERRAAASDARASQATRRQPVSRFRSTQVRTVRQMSYSRVGRASSLSSLCKGTSEFLDVSCAPHP